MDKNDFSSINMSKKNNNVDFKKNPVNFVIFSCKSFKQRKSKGNPPPLPAYTNMHSFGGIVGGK